MLQVGRLTCQSFFLRYCLQLCSYNRIQTNLTSTQLEDSMSLTLSASFQLSACSIDLSSSTAVPKGNGQVNMNSHPPTAKKHLTSQANRNAWEERRGIKCCCEPKALVLPSLSFSSQLSGLSHVLHQLLHFQEHQSWKI